MPKVRTKKLLSKLQLPTVICFAIGIGLGAGLVAFSFSDAFDTLNITWLEKPLMLAWSIFLLGSIIAWAIAQKWGQDSA